MVRVTARFNYVLRRKIYTAAIGESLSQRTRHGAEHARLAIQGAKSDQTRFTSAGGSFQTRGLVGASSEYTCSSSSAPGANASGRYW